MLSQPVNPLLPMLARVCGRTLLLGFVLNLFFVMVPLNLGSAVWGAEFSSRIVDSASIALVGVALLCCAAFVQLMPDPELEPLAARNLARQRGFALRLCRLGMVSLVLLALWQLPLLLGSTGLLNQRSVTEAARLSPVVERVERSIREAPPAAIEQRWQQLRAADAPGLQGAGGSTEQKRRAMLAAIAAREQQLEGSISSRGNQVRVSMVRDALRRIGLCLIYAGGFFGLRRSVLWVIRDPRFPLRLKAADGSTDSNATTIQPSDREQRDQRAQQPEVVTGWWD